MKFLATGLLVLALLIFIGATIVETRYPWVGFIRATAEAAMVGALADWFAVTALFRHPLGLKIPHTAIIPRRKDSIGQQFGEFVKNNFLVAEVITDRLRSLDPARSLADWLSRPANSALIANYVVVGLAAAVQVIRDEEVQEVIERNVATRVRTTSFAPALGNVLEVVLSDSRQKELLTGLLRLGAHLLTENRESIRAKIHDEIPWWLPRSIDKAIYEKFVDAFGRTLQEVSADPDHPLYEKFGAVLDQFVVDLKESPEVLAREESLKEEFLQHQLVRDFSSSLWLDIKKRLLEPGAYPEVDTRPAIREGLRRFAEAIRQDEVMLAKMNGWIERGVLYLIHEYGHEAEHLIVQTIQKWDAEATSRKIELQIGRDLQFIRINGTVVGGLAGLIIYTVSRLIAG